MEAGDTVRELKLRFCKKIGQNICTYAKISVEHIILKFNGRILQDDRTLGDYSIMAMSTLICRLRKPLPGDVFFNYMRANDMDGTLSLNSVFQLSFLPFSFNGWFQWLRFPGAFSHTLP